LHKSATFGVANQQRLVVKVVEDRVFFAPSGDERDEGKQQPKPTKAETRRSFEKEKKKNQGVFSFGGGGDAHSFFLQLDFHL